MKTNKELIVELGFGLCGRLVDNSKSQKNVVYNANIVVGNKKVWFGDFYKHETYKLDLLAQILDEDVYLLNEMDCRFETENNPNINKAIYKGKRSI